MDDDFPASLPQVFQDNPPFSGDFNADDYIDNSVVDPDIQECTAISLSRGRVFNILTGTDLMKNIFTTPQMHASSSDTAGPSRLISNTGKSLFPSELRTFLTCTTKAVSPVPLPIVPLPWPVLALSKILLVIFSFSTTPI